MSDELKGLIETQRQASMALDEAVAAQDEAEEYYDKVDAEMDRTEDALVKANMAHDRVTAAHLKATMAQREAIDDAHLRRVLLHMAAAALEAYGSADAERERKSELGDSQP